MIEFRFARVAIRVAATLSLVACGAFGQEALDEDSLFAAEELTITNTVEGELPAAATSGGDADFLSELFGDSAPVVPEEPSVEAALPAGDQITEAAALLEATEVLPASLDAVVEGINAEPATDIDAFPLDKGVDADAVLGEMLEIGDSEAVAGSAGEAAPVVPAATADVPTGADSDLALDAMLGDMVAEEPGAAGVGTDVPAVAAPVAADDLDFLFGEAPVATGEPVAVPEVPAVAEVVEEKGAPAADDLDFLFGEEPVAAGEPAAVAPVDDDLGNVIGNMVTGTPEPVVETTAEPLVPSDEFGSLFADPVAGESTPTAEPVAAVPETDPADDPMALDDNLFKSLAKEAKKDMKAAPVAVRAPGVVVDPFADALSQPPADSVAGAVAAPAPVDATAPFSLDDFVAAESGDGNAQDAPAAAAAAPSRDLPEGAAAFEEAERLKRSSREYHAVSTLESAKNALRQKDYPRAILMYEQALKFLPPRKDLEPVRAEARKGLGAAYYLQALSQERMQDYEGAKISAQQAVRFGYNRAEETVLRIQRKIDNPPEPPPPAVKRRWNEDDYQKTQSQINAWLKRGREAYLTGEYELAILAFESVLARDPENKEAIRLMHSAANKQYDRSSMELNATSARMIATVRDTWNPRQYGLHETPLDSVRDGTTKMKGDDEIRRAATLNKMTQIRIPEVDFRQANIRDVVSFLHAQSVEFDPAPTPAEKKGVNIILKLDAAAGGTTPAPAPGGGVADFPGTSTPFTAPAGGAVPETLVTFTALDITLKEALDYSVEIGGLKYLIRGNAVIVMPKNAADGEIEHRMYDVLPSAFTRLQELSTAVSASRGSRGDGNFIGLREGGAGATSEEIDLKGFFAEMGVEWPDKASIKFVRGLGKLVVANTLENLTVFEKVLSVLNVVPYQIEIEARFIEVAQTDVDSLGLEWLLTDNWEIAQKKGSAGTPLGARERIQMNENSGTGGFTTGNRFLTTAGVGVSGAQMADKIASISGVLTNPELTVVLHALQQRGHTDLLSAPKITTQSGQAATIRVVTEYIYPTQFETEGIGGNNNNAAAGGNNNGGGVVGAVVTPSAFETREVGVILEVTPEVTTEGQMISLSLSPEVVSEPTWKNYGSTYTSYDPNGNPITQELKMEQPFFHTRKLTTTLLIYNGATVVMGGMITEVRNNVDDKIPLLGDIPLLGRLFRSKYESSEKRNLLIFVTARLVDPSGRALDKERFGADKSFAERIVASEPTSN
jgi:general secretion pathway protein D